MQTFLVTTDLSEESQTAFAPAAALAHCCGASIVLLAVIEDAAQAAMLYAMEFPVMSDGDLQAQFRDRVRAELDALSVAHFADILCKSEVISTTKSAALEIVGYAARHKFDLIVMSTRGKSGLARLLTGSVTMQVLREAPCPVLVAVSYTHLTLPTIYSV